MAKFQQIFDFASKTNRQMIFQNDKFLVFSQFFMANDRL